MKHKLNVSFAERIAKLEQRDEHQEQLIQRHDAILSDIQEKVSKLVEQVKGIRSALYLMAVAIASNVPAIQPLLGSIKELFAR